MGVVVLCVVSLMICFSDAQYRNFSMNVLLVIGATRMVPFEENIEVQLKRLACSRQRCEWYSKWYQDYPLDVRVLIDLWYQEILKVEQLLNLKAE